MDETSPLLSNVSSYPDRVPETQLLQRSANQDDDTREQPKFGSQDLRGHYRTIICILIGSVVGTLVCLTNIHFGMQTGYVNIMQMQSALVGFAAMKMLVTHVRLPFGRSDNILIQSISSSIGAMPAAAGLLGVIPALEYLSPESVYLSSTKLYVWSAGISFFGLIFAAIMRKRIILKENLRFPTGTASALLVDVLHSAKEPSTSTSGARAHPSYHSEAHPDGPDQEAQLQAVGWRTSISLISVAMTVSGLYTIILYFIPLLRNIPIFGYAAASQWLWTLNLSPGYFGQGIITGLPALLNMLAGMILGWGILSPLSKSRGWAPGPVEDWDTGSRGWVTWISLSVMLVDALVGIVYFSLKSFWPPSVQTPQSCLDHPSHQGIASSRAPKEESSYMKRLLLALVGSGVCCIISVKIAFGSTMPISMAGLATIVSLPLALMGINAVGSTDHSPASSIAKVAQVIIGAITTHTKPDAIAINLIAGGVAESGVVQAGFMMQTFKTTYLIGADPFEQLFGMLFGTLLGAIVASSLYKLYTSVYTIPGPIFGVPTAFVWSAAARLIVGQNLPPRILEFGLGMGTCFAICSFLRIRFSKQWWVIYLPSGVPFAVGMYLVPSFTITRSIGGVAAYYWISVLGKSEAHMFIFASGLVLGEGLASIVNLVMEALQVPHY